MKFTLTFVLGLVSIAAAANVTESRRLKVTCDFGDAKEADKFQFDIDFTKERVPVKCVSENCSMQAGEDTWKLTMNTAGQKAGISLTGQRGYKETYLMIKGSNNDDSDLLVLMGVNTSESYNYKTKETTRSPEARAMLIWSESPANGFFSHRKEDVECTVTLN